MHNEERPKNEIKLEISCPQNSAFTLLMNQLLKKRHNLASLPIVKLKLHMLHCKTLLYFTKKQKSFNLKLIAAEEMNQKKPFNWRG